MRQLFNCFVLFLTFATAGAYGASFTSIPPSPDADGNYTVEWTTSGLFGIRPIVTIKENGSSIYSGTSTSTTVSGRSSGTYTYQLWGTRNASEPGPEVLIDSMTVKVSILPIPGVMSKPNAPSTDTDGAYNISWTKPSGTVTSYILQERKNSGGWVKIHDGSATSKSVSNRGEGTYQYRVKACNSSGCSEAWSSVDTTENWFKPGVPGSISGPASVSGKYDVPTSLNWSQASGTITKYEVYSRPLNGNWALYGTSNSTSRTVFPPFGQTTQYRVRACNKAACGDYTSVKSVTAIQIATISGPSNANDVFVLNWTAQSGYMETEVERKLDGGSYGKVWSGQSASTSFDYDIGKYHFRIRECLRAHQPPGGDPYIERSCGSWGLVHTVVVKKTPASITVPTTNTLGNFTVSWSSVNDSGTTYILQQKKGDGSWVQSYSGTETSQAVSGLATDSYQFRVAAQKNNVQGEFKTSSSTIVVRTPQSLSVPSGKNTSGSVSVSWGSVSGSTSYLLQKQKGNTGWSDIETTTATSKSFSDLSTDSYKFRVAAKFGTTVGEFKESSNLVDVVRTPSSISAPSGVSNAHEHKVSWSSVTGATGYRLQQQKNSGDWVTVANVTETFKTIQVDASGEYKYRVAAKLNSYVGLYKTSPSLLTVELPPSKPILSSSVNFSYGDYALTWANSEGSYTHFNFQEKIESSGSWIDLEPSSTNEHSVVNQPKGEYFYRVQSCYFSGCSDWSNVAGVTVLVPASDTSNLSGSVVDGKYLLSWSPATGSVSKYEIEKKMGSGTWSLLSSQSETNLDITQSKGESTSYRVRACNELGCGGYSNTFSILVEGVFASPEQSTGEYQLAWLEQNKYAQEYRVNESFDGVTTTTNVGISFNKNYSKLKNGTYVYSVEHKIDVYNPDDGEYESRWYGLGYASVEVNIPLPLKPALSSSISNLWIGESTDIDWEEISSIVDYYEFQEKLPGGIWANRENESLTFSSSGDYQYRVRAVNVTGPGPWSNTVTISVYQRPTRPHLILDHIGINGTVKISWEETGGDADYFLLRSPTDTDFNPGRIKGDNYTVDSADVGKQQYQVQACLEPMEYCSGWSDPKETRVIDVAGGEPDLGGMAAPNEVISYPLPIDENPVIWSGDVSVSGGALNYSFPIALPPGRNDVQPQLSIGYSSQAGYGLLGQGWNIPTGGAVERCPKIFAIDGVARPVQLDMQDRLCLSGQRLILQSGVHGQVNAIYAPEIYDGSQVTLKGGAISSPSSYFEVKTKSNQTLTFGKKNSSTFVPNGVSEPLSWHLEKQQDSFGNNINWEYERVSDEFRLNKIYYTGYQDNFGSRVIDFEYEAANRQRIKYNHGARLIENSRLQKLKISIDGGAGHEYRFSYLNDEDVDRLETVSFCPSSNICTSNRVEWGKVEGVTGSDIPEVTLQPHPGGGLYTRAEGGRDFDGDGRFDIWARGQGFYLSSLQAWVDDDEVRDLTSLSNQFDSSRVDINLDGKDDLLFTTEDRKLKFATWNSNKQSFDKIDTGVQSQCEFAIALAISPSAKDLANFCESATSDIDGDGATDVLMPYQKLSNFVYSYRLYRNEGGSLVYKAEFTAGAYGAISMRDIDGDGIQDVLINAATLQSDKVRWFKVSRNGNSWSVGSENTISFSGLHSSRSSHGRAVTKWADINGDGLQDLLTLNSENGINYNWYYALNKGNGTFTSFANSGQEEFALRKTQMVAGGSVRASDAIWTLNGFAFAADINQDGIEDLVAPTTRAYQALCDNKGHTGNPCNIDTSLEDQPVQYDVYSWSAFIARFDKNGLSFEEIDLGVLSHKETLFQADLNGDGVMDYGSFLGASGLTYSYKGPSPGIYTTSGNRSSHDLVKAIHLSGDRIEKHRFEYAGLSALHDDGSRLYVPNEQPQNYPYTNFINGMRLIKSVKTDNGLSAFNTELYSYKGAVANLKGRGFAGFREITRTELSTGNRDVSTFLQAFPYGGVVESRKQYTSEGELFFEHRLVDKTHDFGQPSGTYLPRVISELQKDYEIADGTLVSTVTRNSNFDAMGNTILATAIEVDQYGSSYKSSFAEFETVSGCRNRQKFSEEKSSRDNFDHGAGALNVPEQWVRTDLSNYESCVARQIDMTASQSPNTKSTKLTFDQYGNVLTTTKVGITEENRVSTAVYDIDGYFIESTFNSLWGGTVRAYQITNPWFGKVTRVTDVNNRVTKNTLGDFGQVLKVDSDIAPTSYSRQVWCDGSCPGNAIIKSVTLTEGGAPGTSYQDTLGRVIKVESQGFDGRAVVATKSFDSSGRLIRSEEPHFEGQLATFESWDEFDAMNRAGRHERFNNPLGFVTTYAYSGAGVGVAVKNSDGATLSMEKAYGASKQLAFTIDAMGGKTFYRYDGAGRLVSLVDSAGNDTTYEYNGFGEVTSIDDPNSGRTTFFYNEFGERTDSIDANNQTTSTFYDELGRVTGIVNGDDATAKIYDQNGLYGLLTTEARNEEYIRLFDYLPGTLHPSATYTLIEDQIFTESVAWDTSLHRITVVQTAMGEIFRNRFNERGFHYIDERYIGGSNWEVLRELQEATATGATVAQQFMSGIEQRTNRYSGSDIIDGICAGGMNCLGSETIQAIDYRHNAWGNVIGEEHLHNGLNYEYVYDDLHRLTFQTVSSSDFPTYDRDIDYDYDAVGNLLFKTDYADTIYYGNSSKSLGGNAGPHAVRSLITVDGNTHTLVYDNAGNLLTGIGMKVEYDGYNQANKVERNGVVSEYWYNTEGKPYKKITTREHESETTLYIGGSYELITTDDGSSVTESERLNYGGYFVVNKSEENTERRILLTDRLGSVTTIVDADKQPGESGFIKQYRSYDPFGQVRNFQGADDLSEFEITDQGFTGHRHLNDQELIHMNGRVYDYQLGRFLSPDPIILDPKNSQSLNAYSYIMNNPLWGTDPTGYYPDKGDTGQGVNTRSKSEASPTDEEGIASKRSVSKGDTGRTYKPVGSRIHRKVTATAKVDGNGNGTLSYSAGTTKLGSYKISGLMSNSVSGNSVSEMTGVGSGQSSGEDVTTASQSQPEGDAVVGSDDDVQKGHGLSLGDNPLSDKLVANHAAEDYAKASQECSKHETCRVRQYIRHYSSDDVKRMNNSMVFYETVIVAFPTGVGVGFASIRLGFNVVKSAGVGSVVGAAEVYGGLGFTRYNPGDIDILTSAQYHDRSGGSKSLRAWTTTTRINRAD
ncbi:RHS repeat-associated core domain-containing protein [Microbulbifer sp. A4B17]|uniref:RHS repeat-associated core domain-containing protein n=1 Tax=Microbulbifer sp. A4B17 TaxID=359370 RepID=UPI001864961D|nr:RHS repeat-associated core domain-containing protein [Microbulbifer sp. A4B17]